MNSTSIKKYVRQVFCNSKKNLFSNELCNVVFTRVAKHKNNNKLPKWLKSLANASKRIKKHNKTIRARLTRGLRGNGLAMTLIPELFHQGVKYLEKGLALNREAREAQRIENARWKRAREKELALNRKYWNIIKKTRKPLK
jgi:hypothetical protein